MTSTLRKIGLAAATAVTLSVGLMAGASDASAQGWGPGPYGPRPYGHEWHGGQRQFGGPAYFGGSAYFGGPAYYAPRCVLRARWVPGPWGPERVVRRVCH